MGFRARAAASAIVLFARFVTAVRGVWQGSEPTIRQRVYFANHVSHGDMILIWTVLPPALRQRTRAVAAADYWTTSPIRTFIGRDVFNAVLIQRDAAKRVEDPVKQMTDAIDEGSSLILFPEGTRNDTDEKLTAFKSGLYNLSVARPGVELVPTWIDNLNHVMPRGRYIPVPLICTVTFGAPIHVQPSESKDDFIARARAALLALAPAENGARA